MSVKPEGGQSNCQGAIVNEWFVLTHSSCCPATAIVANPSGSPVSLVVYHSFVHEKLCLIQLLQPVEFSDFHLQPVCIDFSCPSGNSWAIALQHLKSRETTSYQKLASDSHCQTNLSPDYSSLFEICSSPLQQRAKCDPHPPQVIGHPLVSYGSGYFTIRGVFSTQDVLPPGAPYDAAGYAATCKDNAWVHRVAFCGHSDYVKSASWVLGFREGRDAYVDELPFLVAVIRANSETRAATIIGPRHVLMHSTGADPVEVAYGLGINVYPQTQYANLPADRKIAVANIDVYGAFKLVTLVEDFPFFNDDGTLNKQVQPICLPRDCSFPGAKPQVGDTVQIAGIGEIADGVAAPTAQTKNITVEIIDQECLDESAAYSFIHDGFFFCGKPLSCEYDWGGPVFSKIGGKYFLTSMLRLVDTACNASKLTIFSMLIFENDFYFRI